MADAREGWYNNKYFNGSSHTSIYVSGAENLKKDQIIINGAASREQNIVVIVVVITLKCRSV